MRLVKVWAYDGVLASSVVGPADVLAAADALWRQRNGAPDTRALFRCRVESPDGRPVRTASGQVMKVDGPIRAGAAADVVLVPGPFRGGGVARFLEEWEGLRSRLQPLLRALRRQHARGALVGSFCSGSFLLAEAGLLEGRAATTHWLLADAFRKRYPQVDLRAEELLVEQGRILCSGAVTSYFALALRLVEKLAGSDLAAATARVLLIDTSRISQASYVTLTVQDRQAHSDELVARGQRWMEERVHRSFRLADLAGHLAVSERTLNRRFKRATGKAPLGYLQSLRLDVAKRLLETTVSSFDAVSERVGYGDSSSFRRLFKRETGLSPRDYRHRFARASPPAARKTP